MSQIQAVLGMRSPLIQKIKMDNKCYDRDSTFRLKSVEMHLFFSRRGFLTQKSSGKQKGHFCYSFFFNLILVVYRGAMGSLKPGIIAVLSFFFLLQMGFWGEDS